MGAQSLPVCLRPDTTTMFIRSALLLAVVCILVAEGQNNRRPNRRQNRRPNQRQQNRNRGVFGRNGVTRNGKVCLPEAQLCAERKQKAGHKQIGGKSYWVSWDSDEAVLRNARWNWFTARNYCRKRCMDLVAFENAREQNAVGEFMNAGNVREVWTSGRLCDKEVDGCEADRFQPYNIRGWFWASSLESMGGTNVFNGRKFNGWSSTGPLNKPQPV